MPDLLPRNVTPELVDLLQTFRIVVLGGARQTGKTTLVREQLNVPADATFSFDDGGTLGRAERDPVGFVNGLPRPSAIDEFQRAGRDFLLAVKLRADRDNTRGQLLLTGSANYLAMRGITETLAGRAFRLTLWPLSAGERRGVRETFLDRLLDVEAWPPRVSSTLSRPDIAEWITEGGFPEIVTEGLSGRRRRQWFQAYVEEVLSREALRPMADVRMETELRRVLSLLAARTSQELVVSELANDAQLDRGTVANYVALLEALHLIVQLPAWSTNITTRVKRHSKVVLLDTGLAADLCGVGPKDFSPTADGCIAGALFETLVTTELFKQIGWAERTVDLFHFRDRAGPEVDIVVEDRRTGEVAGVEIKLTATPKSRQTRHLALLRDRLGARFTVGVLVHAGTQTLPMGPRLWAVPVSALWRTD